MSQKQTRAERAVSAIVNKYGIAPKPEDGLEKLFSLGEFRPIKTSNAAMQLPEPIWKQLRIDAADAENWYRRGTEATDSGLIAVLLALSPTFAKLKKKDKFTVCQQMRVVTLDLLEKYPTKLSEDMRRQLETNEKKTIQDIILHSEIDSSALFILSKVLNFSFVYVNVTSTAGSKTVEAHTTFYSQGRDPDIPCIVLLKHPGGAIFESIGQAFGNAKEGIEWDAIFSNEQARKVKTQAHEFESDAFDGDDKEFDQDWLVLKERDERRKRYQTRQRAQQRKARPSAAKDSDSEDSDEMEEEESPAIRRRSSKSFIQYSGSGTAELRKLASTKSKTGKSPSPAASKKPAPRRRTRSSSKETAAAKKPASESPPRRRTRSKSAQAQAAPKAPAPRRSASRGASRTRAAARKEAEAEVEEEAERPRTVRSVRRVRVPKPKKDERDYDDGRLETIMDANKNNAGFQRNIDAFPNNFKELNRIASLLAHARGIVFVHVPSRIMRIISKAPSRGDEAIRKMLAKYHSGVTPEFANYVVQVNRILRDNVVGDHMCSLWKGKEPEPNIQEHYLLGSFAQAKAGKNFVEDNVVLAVQVHESGKAPVRKKLECVAAITYGTLKYNPLKEEATITFKDAKKDPDNTVPAADLNTWKDAGRLLTIPLICSARKPGGTMASRNTARLLMAYVLSKELARRKGGPETPFYNATVLESIQYFEEIGKNKYSKPIFTSADMAESFGFTQKTVVPNHDKSRYYVLSNDDAVQSMWEELETFNNLSILENVCPLRPKTKIPSCN